LSPKVIIIAGPNGAGKSTLAPALLRDTLSVLEYVNADTIALGLSAFRPEAAALEAGRIMLKRIRNLASQRVSFAFESTLASRSYAPWLQQLAQHGYEFHLVFLWVNTPELAIARVKERVSLGGHDIPEVVVRRRYVSGIKNFFELYQPLAVSWGVYDNSALGALLLIASGQSSQLCTIHQIKLWRQFLEVAK
jgi:predicted ABC-type ATPase